jgi:hypothetical protein
MTKLRCFWESMIAAIHVSCALVILYAVAHITSQRDDDAKRATASEYLRKKEMEDLGKIMMQHHNLGLEVDKLRAKVKGMGE